MSKEEILDEAISNIFAVIQENDTVVSEAEALSAMDKYAEQQAAGFAEWIEENAEHWKDYWVLTTGDESDNTHYTTAELYHLYLHSLSPTNKE